VTPFQEGVADSFVQLVPYLAVGAGVFVVLLIVLVLLP
jgi:hypothetical protein